ncbi:hypothetical protein AB0O18_30180 [Streptomyces sp. NPDC093224]
MALRAALGQSLQGPLAVLAPHTGVVDVHGPERQLAVGEWACELS